MEITEFHLPPRDGERPHQEVHALHERVVERAVEVHARAGGPALYVDVHFAPVRFGKFDVPRLADELAAAVLRHPRPTGALVPAVELPFGELPREILDVHIRGSIDGSDKLWQTGSGGWVAPVRPDDIQVVLDRKSHVARAASGRCDELWLAIVQDWFSGAAPVELADEAIHHPYSHAFARVFWLEANAPRTVEFAVRAA